MVPRIAQQTAAARTVRKPCFHVQPRQGWLNDPNGPIFYGGMYHMFYQYYPKGGAWRWGLSWGHAVSSDLVTWKHLPPALSPTQGGPDNDGCWSGCAVRDTDGTATILYTAVRLRCTEEHGAGQPQHEPDLNLPMIESQCLATAEPGDNELITWRKAAAPIIPLPPHKELGGFRDPFILGRPGENGETEWTMMVGSGIKGKAGTALVYKSPSLHSGWRYDGELCRGIGKFWECPVMAHLPIWQPQTAPVDDDDSFTPGGRASAFSLEGCEELAAGLDMGFAGRYRHMLAVCPDDCKSPVHYYLGTYKDGRFDMDTAVGPFIFDLGDVLYAPQIMVDHPEGHMVLFAWLQERRPTGCYTYAGCLSLPRLLWLEVDEASTTTQPANGVHNGTSRTANNSASSDGNQSPSNGVNNGASIVVNNTTRGQGQNGASNGLINGGSNGVINGASNDATHGESNGVSKNRSGGCVPTVFLRQQPNPALAQLRHEEHRFESFKSMTVHPKSGFVIPRVQGVHVEVVVELQASGSTVSAVALHMAASDQGTPMLLYHWSSGRLELVYRPPTCRGAESAGGPDSWEHVAGGVLRRKPTPGQPLALQLFFDYSVLEVFTGKGETLTTRVYPPEAPGRNCTLELMSWGGPTDVACVQAYELQSIWGAEPVDVVVEEEPLAVEELAVGVY